MGWSFLSPRSLKVRREAPRMWAQAAAMRLTPRSSICMRQTDHAAGAPEPLSPITSDSEGEHGASSEDAPQADKLNDKELNWQHFVYEHVRQHLYHQDWVILDEMEGFRCAKDVGHRIQQDRRNFLRRSAIAGLHFGHAYFCNMVTCLYEWQNGSLSMGSWSALMERRYEEVDRRLAEGPKKPQCQIDMFREALEGTGTLREMLREHTASANATWLGERQEPVQHEPLVGPEDNPVP